MPFISLLYVKTKCYHQVVSTHSTWCCVTLFNPFSKYEICFISSIEKNRNVLLGVGNLKQNSELVNILLKRKTCLFPFHENSMFQACKYSTDLF